VISVDTRPESSPGSVSRWFPGLKAGEEAALNQLWERYWPALVQLARQKLRGTKRLVADEEDIALDAFDSFCRGAEQGRFPNLHDRHNLWAILITVTRRKVLDELERENRKKRGGGKVQGESALVSPTGSDESWAGGIEAVMDKDPTPEFAARLAEDCQRLLTKLGDSKLQSIALWKMEGYTNSEIAAKLGCVVATAERKLKMIRNIWSKEVES
jgi:RNA polymerase sigma factor (sigma-70 family)